jgi:hypothetical protein
MAQRFVELTDAETGKPAWVDFDRVVVMNETTHVLLRSTIDATQLHLDIGASRSHVHVLVHEKPTTILERVGVLKAETEQQESRVLFVAIIGGDSATLKKSQWYRNRDGACCVFGNEATRFVGRYFDEVITCPDADSAVVDYVTRLRLKPSKVVTP